MLDIGVCAPIESVDGVDRMVTRLVSFMFVLLSGLGVCAPAWAAASAPAVVRDVRFSGTADDTRIVIEMNAKPDYRWFTLASQGTRLVVDFPVLKWELQGSEPKEQGTGKGMGLIGDFRYARNSPTTSRLVFDLKSPATVDKEFVLPPGGGNSDYRLVLDIKPMDPIAFIASSGFKEPFVPDTAQVQTVSTPTVSRPPISNAVFAPSLKPDPQAYGHRRKRVIVIDAGHGGKDPGATGKWKHTREKDVNLRAALALKKALDRTGKYDVRLTRSKDVFIPLEGRVKFARRLEADLFISLHSDSAGNSSARGASVYTLAERASGRSKREILKGSSNWLIDVDLQKSRPEVNDILIDLSQRQTKNQSAVFAEMLIPRLARVGPLARNTHRDGNLFVLLAPDVPAVLIEMGFLSNKHDEANLRSDRYIGKLMGAVADGVNAYFRQSDRLHASN